MDGGIILAIVMELNLLYAGSKIRNTYINKAHDEIDKMLGRFP